MVIGFQVYVLSFLLIFSSTLEKNPEILLGIEHTVQTHLWAQGESFEKITISAQPLTDLGPNGFFFCTLSDTYLKPKFPLVYFF